MIDILSAVEGAGQLFAGYGDLTIGPVRLTALELPSRIPVGGRQAAAVHDLPGGARTVDVMGPREGHIAWRGILYSQRQTERARALDRLRQSGKEITLAWGDFSYQVIVVDFRCDTKIIGPMPYHIACLVVSNRSNPIGAPLLSVSEQVISDIATGQPLAAAAAISGGVSVSAASTAASSAATAIGVPGALTSGTSLFSAAASAVNTAAGAIKAARTEADGVIAQVATPLANALGVSPTDFSVSNLAGAIGDAASATGISANLQASHGYFARIAANLLGASS